MKKQTLVVATVAYLTALILYEAWRLAYFGEPLPLPFLSKGGPSESLIASWKSNFNNYFVRQNYDAAPFGFYYLMLGVPAVLLTAAQLLHRRLSLADVAPVAMLVAFATIYLNFVDWMPGMRYQAPLVVLSVLPLASVVRVLGVPPGSRIVMQASLLCAMLFASFFAAAQLRLDVKADIRAQELALDALGRWLQESVPEGTLLAMTDVGGAPYYSGLPTLDINPQSLIDLRIARDGLTPDYFFQEQPGIVVFPSRAEDRLDMFPELHAIEDDSRFRQYRLLGVLRHSFFPNSGAERWYRVYAHESVDISAEATSRFPKGNVSDNAADR